MPSSYKPTVGIDMTASNSLEVFVPGNYEVGAFAHCTSVQGPGCGTPTNGVPAVGDTFYEPKFANASGTFAGHPATTTFDSFDTPLVILAVANPSVGCSSTDGPYDLAYSTIQAVSEDSAYMYLCCSGNCKVIHFSGPNIGEDVSPQPSFGTIGVSNDEIRWLRGAHKTKLLYKEGDTLRVYDVATNRWCSDMSTCTHTSESGSAYHVSPLSGFGFGGNEGDVSPGNKVVLTRTGVNPNAVWVYDVPTKGLTQMLNVPTGTPLDHCQMSTDDAWVGCQMPSAASGTATCNGGQCWHVWNATTGAIQNGGTSLGYTGHAAFAALSDNTPVRLVGADNNFSGSTSPCTDTTDQSKARVGFNVSNTGNANVTAMLCHDNPRLGTAADSHWSAHQSYPNPLHFGVVFDLAAVGATSQVTSGALNTAWDDNWRYLANEIVWCDVDAPSASTATAPECVRLVHHRTYNDNRDCAPCAHITADGQYVVYRSHLGTNISGVGKRIYIIRAGPLFAAGSIPTLTTVSPDNGTQGTTASVTLTGTNMGGASPVVNVSGTGITVQNLSTAGAPTSWTADFVIAAGATTGQRTVSVTTADGTSNTVVFTVVASGAPTLTAIAPTSGIQGRDCFVMTFTGTNFDGTASIGISPETGLSSANIQLVSATEVTATICVTNSALVGSHDFTVTTGAGTSGAQAFTVIAKPVVAPGIPQN